MPTPKVKRKRRFWTRGLVEDARDVDTICPNWTGYRTLKTTCPISANLAARRNALVLIAPLDKRARYLVERALRFGWIMVRYIRCQLPNNEFLKDIGGGSCANRD